MKRRHIILSPALTVTHALGSSLSNSSMFPKYFDDEERDAEISITRFGAVGDGFTDDTNAIQSAIDFASRIGGQRRVIFPHPTKYYKITKPLLCRPSVSLVGDRRRRSRIVNETPNPSFGQSQVFRLGNFHPAYTERFTSRPIKIIGRSSFQVSDEDDGKFRANSIIVLVSSDFMRVGTYNIPASLQLNQILSISDGGVAHTRFPLAENIQHLVSNMEQIQGRDGVPLFVAHDLLVSNFDIRTEGHWMADSCMLNVHVQNCVVESKSGIYGNTVQRSSFSRCRFTCSHAAFEQGHNSIDSTYTKLKFLISPRPNRIKRIAFTFQENAENLRLDQIDVLFQDIFEYFPFVFMNARNIFLSDLNVRGPSLDQEIFFFGGNHEDGRYPCEGIHISESQFSFAAMRAVFRLIEAGGIGQVRNNTISDSTVTAKLRLPSRSATGKVDLVNIVEYQSNEVAEPK